MTTRQDYDKLRKEIEHHNRLYYDQAAPEISDAEYDRLYDRLVAMETEHPEWVTAESPTQVVGGHAVERFEKAEHRLPMLSLEKIRMDNGDYNPDSFGGIFVAVKDQLIAKTSARKWTADDIKRIKQSLTHMNDEGALAQWRRIESFGQKAVERILSYT